MIKPTLHVLAWLALLASAPGEILLNEIHIQTPNKDDDKNYEFIELRSTTDGVESCNGLTILMIRTKQNDPAGGGINAVGRVEEAFNLNGFSTGTNGLLILGDKYNNPPQGGPWANYKAPETTAFDPSGNPPWSGFGEDNLKPDGGLTFLLVRGYVGLANATGNSLGDVDVNNNFIFDWEETPVPAGGLTAPPWTQVVDSVGFHDRSEPLPVVTPDTPFYTPAHLNSLNGGITFSPDSIARKLNNVTPNSRDAWYGGQMIDGAPMDSIAYSTFFGGFKGQVTPGLPNLDGAAAPAAILINEVSINPPGSEDGNFEYIELINANGGAASLQGLTLLVIGSNDRDGGSQLGRIREAWDLNPYATGTNGLLLLGNGYNEGRHPWGDYIDPATQLADPSDPGSPPGRYSSMGDDDIGYSDGFTLLLVRGYTGMVDQDLDTNNDGILDVTPWTEIVDSVGFDQTEAGTTGKTYALAKITTTPAYDYDNLSRKAGNTAANSADAWYGGDYGGNSSGSLAFRSEDPNRPYVGGFRGHGTPGRANLSAPPETVTNIRINEVQVDPVGSPDGAREYIELINIEHKVSTLHGLTLVVADGRPGADNGKILESIDLSMLTTGPNGLVILGDGYDTSSPYDAPNRQISPLTNREDPPGLDVDNLAPNEALLILLVKGDKPAVSSNVSTITAENIVDSIGFGTSPNPAITLLNPGFTPQNISRYPGQYQANSAAAWYGGILDPAGGESSLTYGSSYFGNFKGGASPGRYNHAAPPSPDAPSLVLNEININPPSADGPAEFIELRSTTGGAISTNGYTILQLDSSGNNTGTIYRAWSLDGLATGSNGLLLIGAGYDTELPWTGANAPDPATAVGAPATLGPGDIAGDSDNGATTLLLVRYFNGRMGQDLDDAVPPGNSGADDGILDPQPWSTLVDSVGVRKWDDSTNPPALAGRIYSPTDLSQNGFTPDNVSRKGDDLTPNSKDAWYGGDIVDTEGPTSTGYDLTQRFPAGFEGRVTPGRHNVGYTEANDDLEDPDLDGVPNLLEEALGMNKAVPDAHKLPVSGTVDVSGTAYPALSFSRKTGGTASGANGYIAGGLLYQVEFSTDLVNWTDAVELVGTTPGEAGWETATYRPTAAAFAQGQAAGRMFQRLRLTRQ